MGDAAGGAPCSACPSLYRTVSNSNDSSTFELVISMNWSSSSTSRSFSDLFWLVARLMNGQIVNELLTLQRILADDLPDVAASPTHVD